MTTDIQTIEIVAPAGWAVPLIYGDFSQFDFVGDNVECERVEAFIESLPGTVFNVKEYSERWIDDPRLTDTPDELPQLFYTYEIIKLA